MVVATVVDHKNYVPSHGCPLSDVCHMGNWRASLQARRLVPPAEGNCLRLAGNLFTIFECNKLVSVKHHCNASILVRFEILRMF